jgi:hypothetical protein
MRQNSADEVQSHTRDSRHDMPQSLPQNLSPPLSLAQSPSPLPSWRHYGDRTPVERVGNPLHGFTSGISRKRNSMPGYATGLETGGRQRNYRDFPLWLCALILPYCWHTLSFSHILFTIILVTNLIFSPGNGSACPYILQIAMRGTCGSVPTFYDKE